VPDSPAVERVDVAVVGAGQAGLATSHELSARGIEHVVLERGRIGQTWRGRWDSFCLVTPNWSVRLPGGEYAGPDPDGYLPRDEIVSHLEAYAASSAARVRERVDVASIDATGDGFDLGTSDGAIRARRIVLATGAYQRPHRPACAADLPGDLPVIDAEGYTNAGALPDGRVLVVGSGQTGCQLAEELVDAGRDVVLACGRAPWVTRRYGGRDFVWWMVESGFFDQGLETIPDPAARLWSNPLATGHGGGHDLHLRTLRAAGVTLAGHLVAASDHTARFADDLAASVAWGDEKHAMLAGLIRSTAAREGLEVPEIAEPPPFDASAPGSIDLRDVGAVIFAGGFRPDYRAWLPWGDAFDDVGFPLHVDGESTVVPGLHFVGVHFLRTRKSSLLYGVGEDAALVADGIAGAFG
jgi:putative flavoprotein involved in K+ transport